MKGRIGVFDSGYGGLTILNKFLSEMPEYDYLYLGDNARSPYGTRSFDTIYNYTLEAVKYLMNQDCLLVILACNTASAKALKNIQQLDLPTLAPTNRVLGVIRPTAEALGLETISKHVGVLATQGTVSSESYILEMAKLYPDVRLYQQACPLWVPLIENGELDSIGARYFIQKDVELLLEQSPQIDTILLGCTHYPVIQNLIRELVPDNIRILPQGKLVAASLKDYLTRHPEMDIRLNKASNLDFLTTGSCLNFDRQSSSFLEFSVQSKKVENLDCF